MDKKEEPRRFESEAIVLPPLKMTLLQAVERKQEAVARADAIRKSRKRTEKMLAVQRIIERLNDED